MKEQIKEMYGDVRNAIVRNSAVDLSRGCILAVYFDGVTRELYDDGYRKQSEGEWIITNNRNLEIIRECSHCHAKTYYPIALRFNCRLTRYCEDCGAKMKEATNEKAET